MLANHCCVERPTTSTATTTSMRDTRLSRRACPLRPKRMPQRALKEIVAVNKPAISTASTKATQQLVADKPSTSTASTKATQLEGKGKQVRPVADKSAAATVSTKGIQPEVKGKGVGPALTDATRRAENKNSNAKAKAKGPRKALSLRENGPQVPRPLCEITNAVPNPKAVAIKVPTTRKGLTTKSKLPRPVVAKLQSRQSLVAPTNPATEEGPDKLFSCEEYASDIYRYLCELDQRPCYTVSPDFLEHQRRILPGHRTTLVDWLVQVQRKFRLLPETLYLAIDMLDRYLQVIQFRIHLC